MNYQDKAIELLPVQCREAAMKLRTAGMEEIRLRCGRPPTALIDGRELELGCECINTKDLTRALERATGASMYAAAGKLSEGYVNYGGLRIGICGEAAAVKDGAYAFQSYSSMSIRIPSEHKGICDKAAEQITKPTFHSTVILSPPGGGKTTALRELVRKLSDGGHRISVIDERGEIAATSLGEMQFDVGRCTDVLSYVPKKTGAMMLLRGMNPQIVAMDEITKPEDADTAISINGCGVGLLAAAHAADRKDFCRRPIYRKLLDEGVFECAVIISGSGNKRKYTVEVF